MSNILAIDECMPASDTRNYEMQMAVLIYDCCINARSPLTQPPNQTLPRMLRLRHCAIDQRLHLLGTKTEPAFFPCFEKARSSHSSDQPPRFSLRFGSRVGRYG